MSATSSPQPCARARSSSPTTSARTTARPFVPPSRRVALASCRSPPTHPTSIRSSKRSRRSNSHSGAPMLAPTTTCVPPPGLPSPPLPLPTPLAGSLTVVTHPMIDPHEERCRLPARRNPFLHHQIHHHLLDGLH